MPYWIECLNLYLQVTSVIVMLQTGFVSKESKNNSLFSVSCPIFYTNVLDDNIILAFLLSIIVHVINNQLIVDWSIYGVFWSFKVLPCSRPLSLTASLDILLTTRHSWRGKSSQLIDYLSQYGYDAVTTFIDIISRVIESACAAIMQERFSVFRICHLQNSSESRSVLSELICDNLTRLYLWVFP